MTVAMCNVSVFVPTADWMPGRSSEDRNTARGSPTGQLPSCYQQSVLYLQEKFFRRPQSAIPYEAEVQMG